MTWQGWGGLKGPGVAGGGTRPYRSGHYSGCTGYGLGTAAKGPGHIAPEPEGLLRGGKA